MWQKLHKRLDSNNYNAYFILNLPLDTVYFKYSCTFANIAKLYFLLTSR